MYRSDVEPGGGPAASARSGWWRSPWVPPPLRKYASEVDTLPVGTPGKVGILDLAFERIAGRTELTAHYQKTPMQITRPLYYDPALRDMAHTMIIATGGGTLQGDRHRIDVSCGAGASVHLGTQGATRLYRMERDYAVQFVNLAAGPGSYLEYLPDTTIPFTGSRYYQRVGVTAHPDATVVLGETMMAGRLARGERHDYTVYCSDIEAHDPGGGLLFADPLRLVPREQEVTGPAVMDGFGLLSSLYVITRARPAQEVADAMHETLAGTGLRAGASVLPGDHGAWARILGMESPEVEAAFRLAWDAVRRLLLGVPAPERRRP